jgi:hypothetical protein
MDVPALNGEASSASTGVPARRKLAVGTVAPAGWLTALLRCNGKRKLSVTVASVSRVARGYDARQHIYVFA